MTPNDRIRKKLNTLRERNGWTFTELSNKTGFSAPYLCQIMNGTRDGLTPNNFDTICRALRVKPSEVWRTARR